MNWIYFAIIGIGLVGLLDLQHLGYHNFPRVITFFFLTGNLLYAGIWFERRRKRK